MKKVIPQRLIIYTKDVENLTGKSPQSARRLLNQIRKKLGKSEEELITITEFCDYTGLSEAQLAPFLEN
ncbi:MAG TPA: hypothetical protein VFS25_05260 [Chitinophaga sp.]|jgi:hypothetical protein|uniref:hypothetical protein n=1 Tax=Chitinophaga sp. TaxID=1869181 RepID=UPI002DB81ADB|nr:hypothetical protein [Chitinophaga sp.]HEU4552216.1 hypothetical protein [Chitinophaga sp.]